MISTLWLSLALFAAYGVSFVTKCCLLLIGLRWNKIDYSRGKILLATLLIDLCGMSLLIPLEFRQGTSSSGALGFLLGSLCMVLIVPCAIIARVFKASSGRAFLILLVTLIPAPSLWLFTSFVVKPYAFEGFAIVANSMAPTLLGKHHVGVCSKCGQPTYCSVLEGPFSRDPQAAELVICDDFHVTETIPQDLTTYPGDRILVTKFLEPRRWDLVVFRYPEEPSLTFVKRLIGLPGETITIKNGKVYADGQELTPPAEIQRIEYLTEMPMPGGDPTPIDWGTEDRPAVLGEGEYFVLGDYSARSKDARLWREGAAGHPPYAVPESNMIGVATHIYWPLRRYRTLR